MAWTYSGNPGASELDEVRFLIQDTDAEDPIVQDEEILFMLAEEGSPLSAAAGLAQVLAFRYARACDTAIGDYRVSLSGIAERYRVLAKELSGKAGLVSAMPYAGGISAFDKRRQEEDTDRVPPAFRRGMLDKDGRAERRGE